MRLGASMGKKPPPQSAPLQVLELLQCIPPLLLLLVACGLDRALCSALGVIRQHSFVQYSFRSELRPLPDKGEGKGRL